MAKLGSTKLVFNVSNIEEKFFVDIDCFDIDFSGFKIKSVQKIYKKILDESSETYEGELYLMVQQIKNILKSMGISKSINILNYFSDYMFFENIIIPKLSQSETTKALGLELGKLYDDYDNKYIYDTIKVPQTAQSIKFDIAMIRYNKYAHVLEWFKSLKLNLNYVTLGMTSMRRILTKSMIFTKKRTAIFVDIREYDTMIVAYDSKRIDGSRVVATGMKDVVLALSEKLEKSEQWIEEELKMGNLFEDKMTEEEMTKLIGLALKKDIIEIKRIIGEYFLSQPFDNIFLNIEYCYTPLINRTLRKILKVEFTSKKALKDNIFEHLISYGAVLRLNPKLDYKLPTKVKNYK